MLRASLRAPRSNMRWLVSVQGTDVEGGSWFVLDRVPGAQFRVVRQINFNSGIKGMEGYLKQEKLREKVEQMQDARAKATRYELTKSMKQDQDRESDDGSKRDQPHPPPWEAFPPPMGVQAMAEAEITRALAAGVLDDLPGKGKPLTHDQSTETPWDVDAGAAALNRVLKVAGYTPRSVTAMEKLKSTTEVLKKVLGRVLGKKSEGDDGNDDVNLALRDKNLQLAFGDKQAATRAYNTSLVVDQETYGAGWPLQPAKCGTLEEHVRAHAAKE